nr:DUF6626 family protein [Brevundimonas diminuta]
MDIYRYFHRNGLCGSKREFSSKYLGRAANYLCLRGGRGPSADALIELFQNLWREGRFALAIRVGWAVLWLTPEARR